MKPPNDHAPFSISQRSDLPSDLHNPWREPRSRKLLIPSLHPLYVPRSICNPKEAKETENQIKNKKATKLNLEGTLTLAFLIILQVGPIHTCQSATWLNGREKQLWEGLLGDSMPQCAKCRIGCRVIHIEAIQDGATCKARRTERQKSRHRTTRQKRFVRSAHLLKKREKPRTTRINFSLIDSLSFEYLTRT